MSVICVRPRGEGYVRNAGQSPHGAKEALGSTSLFERVDVAKHNLSQRNDAAAADALYAAADVEPRGRLRRRTHARAEEEDENGDPEHDESVG
jgi:hypothetical protein